VTVSWQRLDRTDGRTNKRTNERTNERTNFERTSNEVGKPSSSLLRSLSWRRGHCRRRRRRRRGGRGRGGRGNCRHGCRGHSRRRLGRCFNSLRLYPVGTGCCCCCRRSVFLLCGRDGRLDDSGTRVETSVALLLLLTPSGSFLKLSCMLRTEVTGKGGPAEEGRTERAFCKWQAQLHQGSLISARAVQEQRCWC